MQKRYRQIDVGQSLVLMLLFAAAHLPALAQGTSTGTGSAVPERKDLLSMDLEALLNVKVTTASKFAEKLSDAPGIMRVVTRDELQRFHGATLAEILNRVPGLALSTASFTDRSMVAARGDQTKINGGHILFLINGRPTREVLEGGIISDLMESFPVNILERVEVILGPGSVLYGSNAYSAVVNLITRKADGNQFLVNVVGGPDNSLAPSAEASAEHGALSLVAAAEAHQVPNWVTPVSTALFGVEKVIIPNRGKGAYLGFKDKGLSFNSSYDDWTTDYIEGGVGQATWRRGFADLGYNFRPTRNWEASLNGTFTRTTFNAKNSIPFITRDSHEFVLEWTNAVKIGDKDRLTVGALYNRIRGSEIFYYGGSGSIISNGSRPGEAFYAQLDHQFLDNLKLIGGFQANKIGSLNLKVVPRGGVIWSPISHYTVKALFSEAFRAPSINETGMDYIPPTAIGGPSLIGNLHLSPEKVATYDLEHGCPVKSRTESVDWKYPVTLLGS
jgi:outer membrane receptor for ferrienterochelin and colicin